MKNMKDISFLESDMRNKIVLLIVLICGVGFGIFYLRKKNFGEQKPVVQSQESFDREVLKKNNSETGEVYGALVRLSKEGKNKDVLSEAFRRYRSPEDKLREASALAFGHFAGPEVDIALKELISDKNPQVRMQAIMALSATPSPERVKMLEEILENSDKYSPQDQITATYSRYVSSPDMSTLEKTKQKLYQWGADTKLKPEDRVQALNRLTALLPKDAKLVSLLQSFLTANSKDILLEQLAIRHLTYIKNDVFYGKAATLFENGSATTRMTLLQVLPQICHVSKWKIVESAAKHASDRPLEWKTALTQLMMVSYEESEANLAEIKKNKKVSESEIQELDRVLAAQKSHPDRNPCQQ